MSGGNPLKGGGTYGKRVPKSRERRGLLSAYETIQTIIAFGMFTIALIGLVEKLLKNDKK